MLSYCRFCLCSRVVLFSVTLSEIEQIEMFREQLQSQQEEHELSLFAPYGKSCPKSFANTDPLDGLCLDNWTEEGNTCLLCQNLTDEDT